MTDSRETRELRAEIVEELWCSGMDNATAQHITFGILSGAKMEALIRDAGLWREEISATQPFGEPLEAS